MKENELENTRENNAQNLTDLEPQGDVVGGSSTFKLTFNGQTTTPQHRGITTLTANK